MNCGVFITGTDTGVGKTLSSAGLLVALRERGMRAVGMKPVASGCSLTIQGLRNDDAELLLAHGEAGIDYANINPYALEESVAPSIAAAFANITIQLDTLTTAYANLTRLSDIVVVEGVGGWAAPLSNSLMQCDLVKAWGLPVILVVGLRLGCINHALLSARAIAADGCELLGWIGNVLGPPMSRLEDNLQVLREMLPAPCLGVLPSLAVAEPRALNSQLHEAVAVLRRRHPPIC